MAAEAGTGPGTMPTKKDPTETGERDPGFGDFIRVFSYATKADWLLMVAACVSSVGTGIVRVDTLMHHGIFVSCN